MFTKSTTLIIPTKDRPKHLWKILNFIKTNRIIFKRILVVDSSSNFNRKKIYKYIDKFKLEFICTFPSTSHQRNIGLKKIKKSKFVMFLDDDIKFYRNSFQKMDVGIKKFHNSTGYCFNIINKKRNSFLEFLKKSRIASILNLYSNKKGVVLQSGWHTQFFNLNKSQHVEWMYSGATIFKFDKINNMKFKLNQYSYCYLEDLDFTYSLFKKNLILTCISNAKILNDNISKRNSYMFGKVEILNRFDFVKKFKLNKSLFFITSLCKIILHILEIFRLNFNILPRVFGNCNALFSCLITMYKK